MNGIKKNRTIGQIMVLEFIQNNDIKNNNTVISMLLKCRKKKKKKKVKKMSQKHFLFSFNFTKLLRENVTNSIS